MEDRDLQIAKTCRSMVRAEGEAMHRRITWLAILQGFLFAGVGFSWKSTDTRLIVEVFGVLGLTVSLLIFISFVGPVLAVYRIRTYWLSHKPVDYDGPDIFGWFPEKTPWSLWITPENIMPLAFAVAWAVLLVCAR